MKSVVVIGAGIIGLCCAWYLNEAGFEVTVVDRNPEGGDNCSQGNSGMIVPSHFVPLASPGMIGYGLKQMFHADSPFGVANPFDPSFLAWARLFMKASSPDRLEISCRLMADMQVASRLLYDDLHSALDQGFELNRQGLLSLALTPGQLEKEAKSVETARSLGLDARLLTAEDARALDPGVEMDIEGAAFHPNDACLEPSEFTRVLRDELVRRDVWFEWSTDTDYFDVADRRLTALHSGTKRVRGDEFVLATGTNLGEMANPLRLKLPMMAGKGYSISVSNPQQRPTVCALIPERRLAMTPMGAQIRFGGTMELGPPTNSINAERVHGIVDSIRRVYPGFANLDLESQPVWAGNRPCTPDGFPYIGRVHKFGNLTIAAGHAMSGVSLAPITGKLVAQTLLGEKPQFAHPYLDPNRYA